MFSYIRCVDNSLNSRVSSVSTQQFCQLPQLLFQLSWGSCVGNSFCCSPSLGTPCLTSEMSRTLMAWVGFSITNISPFGCGSRRRRGRRPSHHLPKNSLTACSANTKAKGGDMVAKLVQSEEMFLHFCRNCCVLYSVLQLFPIS